MVMASVGYADLEPNVLCYIYSAARIGRASGSARSADVVLLRLSISFALSAIAYRCLRLSIDVIVIVRSTGQAA